MASRHLRDEITLTFILLVYAALINLLTAWSFWLDKRAAQSKGRRISEGYLLFCAAIGGSLAAFWACKRFRHKTKKQPFSAYMLAIQAIHMSLMSALLFLSFDTLIG